MTDRRPAAGFEGVRRLLSAAGGTGLSDGQLLGLFVAHRDGAAFEALVRRHGPMVFGVCRRAAGHEQDAEDAFQATFLVLARRAAAVSPPDQVGNWLYGVAHRTALKARAKATRRAGRERPIEGAPEPATEPAFGNDLADVLDAELSRLPAIYRTPLVLCDLEDRPRKDVARQLGIPEGTLSSRLTVARQQLADRLARRGVSVAAAAIATALGGEAVAVPPALLGTAAGAGLPAAAREGVRGAVSALADDVGRTAARGRLAAAAVLLAVAAAGGVVALSGGPPPPPPRTAPDPPPPAGVTAGPVGLRTRLEQAEWVVSAVAAGGRAVDVTDRPNAEDVFTVATGPGGTTAMPYGLALGNLAVAPDAAVKVDNRPAGPADLRRGMRVRLRLDPNRLAATGVEARTTGQPPPSRYTVAAADPARGTIAVAVEGTGVRLDDLMLTPATRVEVFRWSLEGIFRTKPQEGTEPRVGATVSLDLGVDGTGAVVVRRVWASE